MDKDLKKQPKEKFLFNKHIFDANFVPEEEEPPPPIFSQEELQQEVKKAYERGKSEGHDAATQAAHNSLKRSIGDSLAHISSQTGQLFDLEQKRMALFEQEAVRLSKQVFDTLYPLYSERIGFAELTQHLEEILSKHHKQPKIKIHVAEANVEGVQSFLNELSQKGHNGSFIVSADSTLNNTACRLDWEKGGAYHDIEAIAQEIHSILNDTLAGTDATSHNEDGKELDDPSEIEAGSENKDGDQA